MLFICDIITIYFISVYKAVILEAMLFGYHGKQQTLDLFSLVMTLILSIW